MVKATVHPRKTTSRNTSLRIVLLAIGVLYSVQLVSASRFLYRKRNGFRSSNIRSKAAPCYIKLYSVVTTLSSLRYNVESMITDLYSLLAAADCLLLRKYCEILWMSLPRFLFTGYRFFTRYAALHLCGSIQYELPAFTYLPFHVHQVVGTISLLLSMKGLSRGELPMQYHSHIEGLLPVDFPWDCTSFFSCPYFFRASRLIFLQAVLDLSCICILTCKGVFVNTFFKFFSSFFSYCYIHFEYSDNNIPPGQSLGGI